MKLKYTFREVDERLNGRDLPLLSVSKIHGVVLRSELSGDGGRAESIDHYKTCTPGDLVINRMAAYQGAIGVSKLEGAISPDYSVIRGDQVSIQFLFHLLKSSLGIAIVSSLLRGIGSAESGSVRTPRLNWKDLAEVDISLPSKEVMSGVNQSLDQETSQIDALISKKEQLIEKLLERRQAFIVEVLSKGRGETSSTFPGPYLLMSPSNWKVVRVGQVAELVNGFPFDSDKFFPEGQIPLVRIRDLLSKDFETFLSSLSDVPSDKYLISDDDLAIGMDGDFNSILWTRGSAAVNQRVCFLRFKTRLEARFASFVIPLALKQINEVTYSTTVKHLSSGQIVKIPIALPPPSRLGEVVETLESETFRIDTLVEKARKAIELLKERRQALITQVVTGKIDVRGFAGGNS